MFEDVQKGAGMRLLIVCMVSAGLIAGCAIKFAGGKVDGEYVVIDLSAGTEASTRPVTYFDDVPAGGWGVEYKTSKLVLRKVPAGSFVMGSPDSETGRRPDETQHGVALRHDFYIGVFEVTAAQWGLVMGDHPLRSCRAQDVYGYDLNPVERVSYEDIRGGGAMWPADRQVGRDSFTGRLRAKSGLDALDLPTEAQWEYACRAGTTSALNSGLELEGPVYCTNVTAVARYAHNAKRERSKAEVGSYRPNAWGLYDMHGNVSEWCLDWYGAYGGGAVCDPAGAAAGDTRVIRGANWKSRYAKYVRSAAREENTPSLRSKAVGFRLAMTSPKKVAGIVPAGGLPESAVEKRSAGNSQSMVLIPAGTFEMGDTFNDGDAREKPVHTVSVSAFLMDTCEVPYRTWREVHAWSVTNGYAFDNAGMGRGPDHPVAYVNWYDAVKWCNARSRKEGLTPVYYEDAGLTRAYVKGRCDPFVKWEADGFRLPTEAEWEKAARGGAAGKRFPRGDTISQADANYLSEREAGSSSKAPMVPYDVSPFRLGHRMFERVSQMCSSPCGTFLPNGYGLYDMDGNEYEWCWDWYDSAYYANSPQADPRGPEGGKKRVLRGGAWLYGADQCRAAYRRGGNHSATFYVSGFRTVRAAGLGGKAVSE